MSIKVDTYGRRDMLNLFSPDAAYVDPEDVALALSREARYNGLTDPLRNMYSVAQHSVHLHDCVLAERGAYAAALALIHDAPEYVLGDQITPLKKHMFVARPDGMQIVRFEVLEDGVFKACSEAMFPGAAIGLNADGSRSVNQWKLVHEYDQRIVHDEWVVLRPRHPVPESILARKQLGIEIEDWTPQHAAEMFWDRYQKIKAQVVPTKWAN